MRILGSVLVVLGTVSTAVLPARQAPLPPSSAPAQVPPREALPDGTALGGPVLVPSPGRVFASEAGMVLSTVRADKVADFEKVVAQVHLALARSTDPVRRAQAAGWKVFRAAEAGPQGSVLYLFVMNPAVTGADYTVSRVLAEAFPDDVQALFQLYSGAVVSQSLLSLTPVADFGAAPGLLPAVPASRRPAVPLSGQ